MNIGIFTNNYKPRISGLTVSIDTFKETFTELGHNVFVFCPEYKGYRDSTSNIIRFRSFPFIKAQGFSLPIPYSFHLFNKTKDLRLDIIHAQHPYLLGKVAKRWARRLKIPLVFTHHTLYEEYAHYIPFNQKVIKKLAISSSTSFANNCDLVIVPTPGVKDLIQGYGVKTRIEIVPTGVNLEDFRKDRGREIRKEYKIPPQTKILLYLGRFAKEKNIEFLLHVYKKVQDEYKEVVLFMVGYGPQHREILNLSKRLDIRNIIFTGSREREDIIKFYQAADLFIFSSLTETQGIILIESLAAGTPVVAVNASGTKDIITHGVTGYLTDLSVPSFVKRVIELLRDDRKREEFSKNAKVSARMFSSLTTGKRLIDLYQELIDGRCAVC
ncbi:MAG: glycosyltransferase family 4 protein [bacterium]|nr:glycosyltransferase family 4 protein [bacterium]